MILPRIELPGADRGDDQLLDRAPLRSRTMAVAVRIEVSSCRIIPDQRRDHEEGADQIGVVPNLGTHLNRQADGAPSPAG